jgi:xylulokinase
MSVLLGIDLGTTATKAVLVDPAEGVVAVSSADTDVRSPAPGWAEADPAQWWCALERVVPRVLAEGGVDARDVGGIATSGMVPAVLLLDESGRPLRAAILQNDARAVVEIAELGAELEDARLLERTGSPLTQQSVAPTLRWLARHEPEVWRRAASVAGSYDWLLRRLGGEPHLETNWALESGLFQLDGELADDVLAATGCDAALLPPVRRPGDVVGTLARSPAAALGLAAGTPLVVGGADHVASAYAAGLARPGDTLIKLGGAGDILAVSVEPVVDERLYLDRHMLPDSWLPNGCMATSGSLLRWFQRLAGGRDLAALDADAARVGAGAGGVVCLPYLLGEKSPIHDPAARGAFAGLHLGHTTAHLHRACLEAVAFGFRHHLDVFRERGLAPRRVRITNGGSRSSLWIQIVSDVCDLAVEPVPNHPGAALGAAFAAAVGVGAVEGWEAIERVVLPGETVSPAASAASRYDELYALYRDLGDALADISHRLAALADGGAR